MKCTWWAVVLLFIPLALAGSQQISRPNSGGADPAWSALNGSMAQMHGTMMSVKPSGNSDADFIRLMLPHHEAAIGMARTELIYGKDPQLRRLAQEIITDQQSEIELMELWLKQHEASTSALPAQKEQ